MQDLSEPVWSGSSADKRVDCSSHFCQCLVRYRMTLLIQWLIWMDVIHTSFLDSHDYTKTWSAGPGYNKRRHNSKNEFTRLILSRLKNDLFEIGAGELCDFKCIWWRTKYLTYSSVGPLKRACPKLTKNNLKT